MIIRTRLKSAFKNHVLKPQLKRLDAWEKMVYDHPGALRGGDNSPVRFNIPVVLTILVTIDGLDEDSMSWIKDELNVVSTKDWLGGEVQSILLINQNKRIVGSLKDVKQGDTIALNHALDLIQTYLNKNIEKDFGK